MIMLKETRRYRGRYIEHLYDIKIISWEIEENIDNIYQKLRRIQGNKHCDVESNIKS